MDSFEQSEEALFEKCLELPRDEREAYLDRVCGENTDLKDAVLGLLRAHDTPHGFLEHTVADPVSFEPDEGEGHSSHDESRIAGRQSRASFKRLGLAIAFVLIASLIWFSARQFFQTATPLEELDALSIGLLPFDWTGDEDTASALAQKLPQSIAVELSGIEGMSARVGPPDTGQWNIRERAEALQVRSLLVGSVQQVGNQLQIGFEWVDALNGATMLASATSGLAWAKSLSAVASTL